VKEATLSSRQPFPSLADRPIFYEPKARGAARGPWSFAGFPAGSLVNMDYVRDEAERLIAEEELDLEDERITRPQKGKIV
jgi:hypothetical protein